MRLWTFQARAAIKELETNGILYANWSRYTNTAWKKAYAWMAQEMTQKGIACEAYAPIWAWHSCSVWQKGPTLGDARSLLSDIELENGIQTIELECPDVLVLLSNYNAWNNILDHFIDQKPIEDISITQIAALYDISNIQMYNSIQATLPYLQQAWVVDIRPLKLKVGDYSNYNEKELV